MAGLQGRRVDSDSGRPHSEVTQIYCGGTEEEEEETALLSGNVQSSFIFPYKRFIVAWHCSNTE